MSCSADLWGGLIKNKGGVGLFQISEKERLFHESSYHLAMWTPSLHPSKKNFSFPFSLGKKRIYQAFDFSKRNSYTNTCLKFLCDAKLITSLLIFLISGKKFKAVYFSFHWFNDSRTCEFELVIMNLNSELVDMNSHFWILTRTFKLLIRAFKLSTRNL